MTVGVNQDEIKEYYAQCHSSLDEGWIQNSHRGVHVGYYENEDDDLDTAVENMTRVTADAVDIGPKDDVLCAGCGVGGPATWLAKERGASVTGINISEPQLELARELAQELGVSENTAFQYGDFTEMEAIPDDEFDVIWGLEAICHADDKRKFLQQAKRVLRDGGRIVVADGYAHKPTYEGKEKKWMDKWLYGWKCPHLATVDEFSTYLSDLGFTDVTQEDVTENIVPSLEVMFRYSLFAIPIGKILSVFGKRSETELENIVGCYYQYRSIKKDLWGYYIISAEL
ncbi:SAM-dependent methyltransferase [Haloarcula amylolytica]|uniref:UbiE/COQ5 family methyltransferase n=1 Tax=Haloarcula amylolytica JCM 13557 TaxID=1227452 RepID=M0K828_9EURY|nr:methyltransferase domain-containing protein [Haloarcula amylolytica]EMA15980.1 UbiE/COQ5 family methyltransferase [Haloarcula amylolytica JCM 13557]